MDIINLLEKLAKNAHYHTETSAIIDSLPDDIKNIFLTNNAEILKKQLSSSIESFANELTVVAN